MSYRADFFMGIVGVFALNGATLGTSWVLLNRFHTLNGWVFWEVVFLYNLWLLSHSVRTMFFRHINTLELFIVEGTFDQFLIRPISPLLQFLGREFHYLGVGDLLLSVTGLTLAYWNLGLHWSALDVLWFIIVVLAGATVETCITLGLASAAFKTTRSESLINAASQFSFGVVQQYPVDLFNRWLAFIVTVILPFAFMNYYPSLYFLNKTQQLGGLWFLAFLSPAVAALLLVVTGLVWRWGVRQYQSTGS
jgi:ABC-2 type transport system permease protein